MSQHQQKIALASDHAGFSLKAKVCAHLVSQGFTVDDLGPSSPERMDYPDTAHAVARMVADGGASIGILVCGSGVGMAMAANRHPKIPRCKLHIRKSGHAHAEPQRRQRVVFGRACRRAPARVVESPTPF